jgi:release factor glutamine methyltransferase
MLASEPAAKLEAEILLRHSLGVSRSWLYANPEQEVAAEKRGEFLQRVKRRQRGEPIAYITGNRDFWTFRLKVSPAVLIPRPETELLVETALKHIPIDAHWRIADLGTGCGAIALAIVSERPHCEVHASDISHEALAVAQDNAKTLGLDRIQFHQGAWLQPLEGRFHCIVSNPPYVSSTDVHMNEGDCRFEPPIALSPGDDGLSGIRQIITDAPDYLDDTGFLIFEHGFEQGPDCRNLLRENAYTEIETIRDLAGHERVTLGRKQRVSD